MNETIRYCANTHCQHNKTPSNNDGNSTLCQHCENQIHTWLTTIPDLYTLLPTFIEHGTTERNPDSKTTKAPEAPAPMRLEIIDLLDTRLGRKWQGFFPAHDRRGVAGTLQVHVDTLREERNLTQPHNNTSVTAACALLNRHRLWIAEQDWATHLHNDLKTIHRTLSDATGDYRRPPVGHCHIENDQSERCNGNLYPNTYGGVRCARCGATWDPAHLRQLGLAQAESQTTEPT